MNRQSLHHKIVRDLAEKYNLRIVDVEAIINSQFKFIYKVMREGNMESVRVKYLGLFGVTPYYQELYKKRKIASIINLLKERNGT